MKYKLKGYEKIVAEQLAAGNLVRELTSSVAEFPEWKKGDKVVVLCTHTPENEYRLADVVRVGRYESDVLIDGFEHTYDNAAIEPWREALSMRDQAAKQRRALIKAVQND